MPPELQELAPLAAATHVQHFIPLVPSKVKDVANVVSTTEYEEIVENQANAPDTKVSYSNFGQRIKSKLWPTHTIKTHILHIAKTHI